MNRCHYVSKHKLENFILNQSDVKGEEWPVPHGRTKKLNVKKEQTSHENSSKMNIYIYIYKNVYIFISVDMHVYVYAC